MLTFSFIILLSWGIYVFYLKEKDVMFSLNLGKFSHAEKQCSGFHEMKSHEKPFFGGGQIYAISRETMV